MPVVPADLNAASNLICTDAHAGKPRVYALVNAHSAKLRRDSAAYAGVLDSDRTLGLPDGASMSFAARLVGHGDIGRSPGPDLLEVCAAQCAREGLPVFLLGGADGVADSLSARLRERHEGLVVAGVATPPFGDWPETESARLLASVRQSGARVLWMGVSAPKQEVWAHERIDQLGMPAVCVGAAFDFSTGRKSRAPRWMRSVGLEWAYRLMTEPRRMWQRYLVGNSMFLFDALRYGRRRA